jgi:SET domain-containing protein
LGRVGVLDFMYTFAFVSLDIASGEELLYDYGDRRVESIANFPWLRS